MAEHSTSHFPADTWVFPQSNQVTNEVMERTTKKSKVFVALLLISLTLVALGIIGFVIRLTGQGLSDYSAWGYYMAAFSFVFMITSSAP